MNKGQSFDVQKKLRESQKFHSQAREGVSYEEIIRLIQDFNVTENDISSVLGLNQQTLDDCRSKQATLPPLQGEQLLKYRALLEFGTETFGSTQKFLKWLNTHHLAFGKEKPVEYMVTADGINIIYNEVGRIAFGVLA